MKNLFFLSGLVGSLLCFNACAPAYVAVQPTYQETVRPPRPGNTQVWMDDDWAWNRRQRIYVQQNGHWVAPNQGRAYTQGHWISNKRGNRWVKGHWR